MWDLTWNEKFYLMNKTYLSKSSYCKCVQCKKIHWLSKYKKIILYLRIIIHLLKVKENLVKK